MSRSMLRGGLAMLTVLAMWPAPAQAAQAPSPTTARAVLVPSHNVEVVSPVRGVIKRILVEEGDAVKKDQLLVEIDSDVQKASLAISEQQAKSTASLEAAEANLRVKRADHARQVTLHEKGVGSEADLEKAEFELKYAESLVTVEREKQTLGQLKVTFEREKLEMMNIRAPLAGIVVRRLQDVGEGAQEDRPMLQLVDLDILHVIAYVPQRVASKLRVDMQAELELEDAPTPRHKCRIIMIDPLVDAASSTCRIKLELANKEHKVAAGSRAVVHFHLNSPPTAAAAPPASADRRP